MIDSTSSHYRFNSPTARLEQQRGNINGKISASPIQPSPDPSAFSWSGLDANPGSILTSAIQSITHVGIEYSPVRVLRLILTVNHY